METSFNYQEAVEKLKKLGPVDRRIARVYGKKETKVGRQKIQARLDYWAKKKGVAPSDAVKATQQPAKTAAKGAAQPAPNTGAGKSEPVVTIPFTGNFKAEEFDALPQEIQELEKRIKGAHTIRSFHRAQLLPGISAEARAESVRIIAESTDIITEAQAHIDFFKKNGTTASIPDENDSDDLPNDLVEVIRLLKNCVTRISKAKAKLEKEPESQERKDNLAKEEGLKLKLTTKKALLENATTNE